MGRSAVKLSTIFRWGLKKSIFALRPSSPIELDSQAW